MRDKRIPTILGTILLVAVLALGVWLSSKTTQTQSKASSSCTPIGIQITNLTNKSCDISFTTDLDCVSSLKINNKIIPNSSQKKNVHYFRVDNLSADTQYQYSLTIDGAEHNQPAYIIKTAPLPSGNMSSANLAWGKVITPSGLPSDNSIIYLNIPGAWPLSALTDNNGQWHITTNNSFSDDKKSMFVLPNSGNEDIIVYPYNGKITQVENSVTNNDPVPDIVIGQGFVDNGLGSGPGTQLITTPTSAPQPTSSVVGVGGQLSITYPSESESIGVLRPDIFGTGKSNSTVNLSIDSEIIGKTTSRADGGWNWSPDINLKTGKHVLTVTLGSELLQRSFTISPATGSTSPLSFSATPSATIAPTLAPTTIPTAIPTVRTSKPSTKSGIPVTGNTSPFYLLILSSLFTVSFSLYFFYRHEK